MFVLTPVGKVLLSYGLAGISAGPVTSSVPVSLGGGSLSYDPKESIEISGAFYPDVCTSFGCSGPPCDASFNCLVPIIPMNHDFSLDECGASVVQVPPDFDRSLQVSGNNSASASVTGSGSVTAYAGIYSLGAKFDIAALLAAQAASTGCPVQRFAAGASLAQSVTVEIPFTTVGGEFALKVLLQLSDCANSEATGSWSITTLGPWNPVVAEGPIDTAGFTAQGIIPQGDYLFRATLNSFGAICACAPCFGSDSASCTHDPDLTVSFAVSPCLGDVTGDGQVATTDLLALLAAWGPCAALVPGTCAPDCPADLNGDRTVDNQDLLILLANWGPC